MVYIISKDVLISELGLSRAAADYAFEYSTEASAML